METRSKSAKDNNGDLISASDETVVRLIYEEMNNDGATISPHNCSRLTL
jgi:hypothetical protein